MGIIWFWVRGGVMIYGYGYVGMVMIVSNNNGFWIGD